MASKLEKEVILLIVEVLAVRSRVEYHWTKGQAVSLPIGHQNQIDQLRRHVQDIPNVRIVFKTIFVIKFI